MFELKLNEKCSLILHILMMKSIAFTPYFKLNIFGDPKVMTTSVYNTLFSKNKEISLKPKRP